jgi:hypothetical protein
VHKRKGRRKALGIRAPILAEVVPNGTELTSNAIIAWSAETGIEWHCIVLGKAHAERLRRVLQWPHAGSVTGPSGHCKNQISWER